jgi:hypothetical protein
MKPTLARLKIILRSNVDSFVNSAIISSVLYLAVYILVSHLLPGMHVLNGVRNFRITHAILLGGAVLFFSLPVAIYMLHQTSQSLNGITLKPTDPVKAKHFLFMQSGILWTSLAILCVAIAQNVDYLALTALIVGLINWVAIHRTVGAYAIL